MAQIIDGKAISRQIKDELKEKVASYKEQGIEICLAVIQVGSDPASSVYVGNKKKACEFYITDAIEKTWTLSRLYLTKDEAQTFKNNVGINET